MTYSSFSLYYGLEEHGGYTTEQLREKWSAVCNDDVNKGKPCDHLGVVKGQAGHARIKVLLEDADDSVSEDETEKRRVHEKASKAMDEISVLDIIDFLEGRAELETPLDETELPPELANDAHAASSSFSVHAVMFFFRFCFDFNYGIPNYVLAMQKCCCRKNKMLKHRGSQRVASRR